MLDRLWGGATHDGVRVYEVASYRAGFALALAWLVCSLVALVFTHETHCRQRGASAPHR